MKRAERLQMAVNVQRRTIVMGVVVLLAVLTCGLQAQATVTAVVNAASYTTPVEPGSIVSIFGSDLATTTASAAALPLPATLGGTAVSINGVTAPLLFVSPGQINAQVPSALQSLAYGSATLIVTSGSTSGAPFQFQTAPAGVGMFTLDESGCGAAAALNVAPDGTVLSINSPGNSAQPGDYLTIFSTGLGPPGTPVPDGAASPEPDAVSLVPGATLGFGSDAQHGSGSLPYINYAGLAPGMAGIDQMNLLIPQDVTQGCSVPLTVDSYGLSSLTVSVSIHSGRGQCVDPPSTSYGRITLTRTINSGTAKDGETDAITAIFPSGPNIQSPAPPKLQSELFTSSLVPPSRSCAVPGYTNLSAGGLTVQTSGKAAVTVSPQAQPGGVIYQQDLPASFLQPGQYTVASGAGAPISFSSTFSFGSPIQIQTDFKPGTVITATQGLHLAWTGGDPGALVRVKLYSPSQTWNNTVTSWTTADAGSVTITGRCTLSTPQNPPVCGWGFPVTTQGQVIIEVLPPNGVAATTPATGLTQGVQSVWVQRYVFGGISLTN